METNNISMSCTHEGVTVNLTVYFKKDKETSGGTMNVINVTQRIKSKGYDMTRHDMYDLEGKRITDVEEFIPPFTEAYYAQIDKTAKDFAAYVSTITATV